MFLPEQPGEHGFQFPLSFEGIPPDGAKHLQVPVSAKGLKPTLTFGSTKFDFGRTIVSRDPSILKQYQGEFTLRNASDKVTKAHHIMDAVVHTKIEGAKYCPVHEQTIER